jgi:hypothetical protein
MYHLHSYARALGFKKKAKIGYYHGEKYILQFPIDCMVHFL